MSAAGFPSWVLLEPFVFRRDDDKSFPDESKAPVRATATTSWFARFAIAFDLADPPRISRLYANLPEPGFPDRRAADPLALLATHLNLALLRVGTTTLPGTTNPMIQDFFVFNSKESSLKLLPRCDVPEIDYTRDDDLPRIHLCVPPSPDTTRLLAVKSMGLWCEGGDFVVAEFKVFVPLSRTNAYLDICLLRASTGGLPRNWNNVRVNIRCGFDGSPDEIWVLCSWETGTVIPFQQYLCLIDYNRGIIFCDMSKERTPYCFFVMFDLPELSDHLLRDINNPNATREYSFLYRGVSVVDRALKFVHITRDDGVAWGTLKPRTGFTITCHTLSLNTLRWQEDYKITSSELWDANLPDLLPRCILLFPQVDIDRPDIVYFLLSDYGYVHKNMWVVSIDMSTKTVKSCSPYINVKEGLQTEDADFIRDKSLGPLPFIPCEFPSFLYSPRKSMESH